MKISLNTIKKYAQIDLPSIDELRKKISEQLGGIDEVINLHDIYKDAVIVRVVAVEKHPDADRLSVCQIDHGSGSLTQVVCGAPNVQADMWAVWLPPSSTVPSTYHDAEPFVLGARELRGVMSNGMLAAGDELAINSDHDGIVSLTENDLTEGKRLFAGASFAETFGLDDTIIDIENKMFTHRPDLFGQLGVAREIAGIFGHSFSSPSWYLEAPNFSTADGLEIEVFNDATDKVPRFMAVAIKDVQVKPSPFWLQCALVSMGSKAINNVVDATNYVMLLTAQPTHAYDYDKLRGHKLGARMARKDESALLLNGKTYQLSTDDIVVADGEGVIGLAGIMGGGNSEVSAETRNIVLEVATFDMYAVRKTSMRHGVFTDALTRFNKGQSPLQNPVVAKFLVNLITEIASGKQSSPVFDLHDELESPPILSIDASFVNQRLGLKLSGQHIADILKKTEFDLVDDPVEVGSRLDDLAVPFWRTDIEQPEDIVEEVGRLYGFDKLPRLLPNRSIQPAPKNQSRALKQVIRQTLAQSGANEVLTYSFVHKNVLTKAKQDPQQAFQISNALSPDLQYYRLNVLPSLLDKVHMNIKAGNDQFILFEIGKGHEKARLDSDSMPVEIEYVDGVFASKEKIDQASYFRLRRTIEFLFDKLDVAIVFRPINEVFSDRVSEQPFDLQRSARIESHDGQYLGIVGELQPAVSQGFKLPTSCAAFSLDFAACLAEYAAVTTSYVPLSRYPSISQDISLRGVSDVRFADIFEAVRMETDSLKSDLKINIEPISIYRDKTTEQKTTTLRLVFTSFENTLTDQQIAPIMDAIAKRVATDLSLVRV